MVKGINKTFFFGRNQPSHSPNVKLKTFLNFVNLPTPPASVDYTHQALTSLHNVYMNDQIGNCVIAGGYHVEGVTTAGAGLQYVAGQAQLVNDYHNIGGYIWGQPSTDNGCNEQTAFDYWMKHGFASGNKLGCWMGVDATSVPEMKQALYLFENLFSGVALPDSWITPMPSGGFVWDVAGPPVPDNGHCITHFGYNDVGLTTSTWGMLGTVTWQAMTKYMVSNAGGELYVLVMPDMINKVSGKAPNGLDWKALSIAANQMGGNLPIPPIPIL